MSETYRKISPADFGAQMLTAGGMSGIGTGAYGTRWEFHTKEEANRYKEALQNPRHKENMSEAEIKAFVVEMGSVPMYTADLKASLKPTNTLTLDGQYFEPYKTFKQLVGEEDAPESEWSGKTPQIGVEESINIPEGGKNLTETKGFKEHFKGTAMIPVVLVGICVMILWYFLFGNMRRR